MCLGLLMLLCSLTSTGSLFGAPTSSFARQSHQLYSAFRGPVRVLARKRSCSHLRARHVRYRVIHGHCNSRSCDGFSTETPVRLDNDGTCNFSPLSANVRVVSMLHSRSVGGEVWLTSDGRAYFVQLHELMPPDTAVSEQFDVKYDT